MEKKNTILLTVIAVATLLVAVVGATFAYFTATNETTGSGGTAQGTTSTDLGSTSITMSSDGIDGVSNMTYPGGIMVAGAKVEAKVTGAQSYNMSYNVNVKIDTTGLGASTSTIKYTLYRVDDNAVAAPLIKADSCEYHEEQAGTTTKYYYTGCAAADGIKAGDTVIATEEITVHNGEATTDTVSQTIENVTSAGATAYYYLVVEYVNAESDQSTTDAGKSISATIESISNGKATLVSNGQ